MRVFLIAGEPSGDALGAALIEGLRVLRPAVQVLGVGGPLMAGQGLHSLFPMDELSIMGLAEVLPKYRALKRRIAQTAQAIAEAAPDVVITIDSPDFCLRVLALAKAATPALRTVHYVAPSVWAWRPGRAVKMARVVDHVLALLPFEPPFMTAAGMTCDFVGHPITTAPRATEDEAILMRAGAQVRAGGRFILALPGSRRGEVTRLLPIFGAALAPLVAEHPHSKVVIPTTPNVTALVRDLTSGWSFRPIILDPTGDETQQRADAYQVQKRAAFRAADVALAASGTVSLELAAAQTPMVVGYRMNPISHAVISRLLRVDTVTLVNLVSETRTVPEFIGPRCTPDRITAALRALLTDPAARDAQLEAMALTMTRLGEGGEAPGLRAARSVLAMLDRADAQ